MQSSIIGKINKTSTSFYAEGYGTYQEADMIQERIYGRKKGTFHLMDMSLSLSYMRNKLAFEKDGTELASSMFNGFRTARK